MYNILIDLENCFSKSEYISDRRWLERTLHENFHECGKSGLLYDRKQTVESLLSCASDRDILIHNFECMPISVNSWLVHYITKENDKKYYRTSVWVKDENVKLLFHQASELRNI
ncbi:MAG: nuclear transport factor 2 family protein [Clostridia bacterium]|nr:nuclear transport factor 2 family protein [Clostridia bacterium]